jgi:hypothetical protein
MTHRGSLLRRLFTCFGQLAQDIQLSDGSIWLHVNQQRLAKIATSLRYYHHRPHSKHSSWTLRHDPWETAVGQIPDHVTSEMEEMVTDLVPDFGWVEINFRDCHVSYIMIHVSFEPPSHSLAC